MRFELKMTPPTEILYNIAISVGDKTMLKEDLELNDRGKLKIDVFLCICEKFDRATIIILRIPPTLRNKTTLNMRNYAG